MARPTPQDPSGNLQPDASDEYDERDHAVEQSTAQRARPPRMRHRDMPRAGQDRRVALRGQDVPRRAPPARSQHAHAA